ncbi:MAG: glycogen debranching enzyme, partial [Okeania sp. SIO2H7]|nr:glycogen debranching enzyme [Okeania sp. SIO2H7]
VLWAIETDPILAGAKIIAEAWDAAGLYQVGSFIGDRFAEWNGPFRDDARCFIKSDRNTVTKLAARIMGSPDIYPDPEREPNHSINFVTCHDGFTINDLVSYSEKHNEANNEENRDGSSHNFSWNCGCEGPTDSAEILALRQRQIKNFFTILFLSQGTPMILMGDEVRRSQLGNNNPYCQDNELSWFDWEQIEKQADLLRFVKSIIHLTQNLAIFQIEERLATIGSASPKIVKKLVSSERSDPYKLPNITWHGVRLWQPDWSEDSHTLALTLQHPDSEEHLHVMLNSYWQPLKFELPPLLTGERWHRIIDTALRTPDDFCELEKAPEIEGNFYKVESRSAVLLMAY